MRKLIPVCSVLAVLSVILTVAAAVMGSENIRLKNEVKKYAEEAAMANAALTQEISPETSPAVSEPVDIQENIVYIYDNGIEQIEYPEIEGVKRFEHDMSLLETGEKKHKALYNEKGEKISRFGVDVSSYQGKIDWQAAAADGVEFAVIRMGYRGYETGAITEDKYFRRNIEGANASGIDTGVYFFSQAISPEEASEEAEYVIEVLEEYRDFIKLPVVFDWEFVTDEDPARTDGMDGQLQTLCCKAFCDRIRESGYDTMYYSTVNTALFRYDMPQLTDNSLWIAEYCERTQFTYDYKMWQYSCSGVVDGIDALTDLNIMITE